MNKTLWMLVLLSLVLLSLALNYFLLVQFSEQRKISYALAIKMDGLEDRMNYQMQLIDKLQKQQQRAETTNDLLHRGSITIEYSHPIYKIPENNK